jgi:hypothetical protein
MLPVDVVAHRFITKQRVLWLSIALTFVVVLGFALSLMTNKKETEVSWLYSQTAE